MHTMMFPHVKRMCAFQQQHLFAAWPTGQCPPVYALASSYRFAHAPHHQGRQHCRNVMLSTASNAPPPTTSEWQPTGAPASHADTQALVETAMLSAVTGLAYLLASIIKVEAYLGYLLPFPVIISAMRSGPAAARKTMTATCFLLLVLLGPVRALSYLLAHGLYALTLGALWAIRAPWIVSVPLGMAVRVAGALAYLCVASWALNENMLALLVANVTSLVDQIAALFGVAGSPSLTAVLVTMVVVMLVNSAFYVTLMHLLYEVILRQLGYETGRMPAFVSKWMYAQRLA